MKILVTGAKGFVGKNLCWALKNIQAGKDRTHPAITVDAVYEYDLDSTPEELEEWCKNADFVFNLAGVNRPQNQEEFMKGNFGFASTLLDTLKKYHNTCPVMLSSSQQASLTGRFGNSEYGRSKKAGEDMFLRYEQDVLAPAAREFKKFNSLSSSNSDALKQPQALKPLNSEELKPLNSEALKPLNSEALKPLNSEALKPLNSEALKPLNSEALKPRVLIYRFPNLFGKWCRPNYNSAVATFCNAFANDLPYTVNDPSVELELLYIDDLVDEMLACLEGKEHRCEFNGLDVIPAQPSTSSSAQPPTSSAQPSTSSAQPSTSSSAQPTTTSSSAQPPTSTLPAEGSVSSGLSAGGRYCYCPITHHVTLGEIVELLKSFAEQPRTLMIPEIPAGSFAKKLYSTYLSYLPYEKTAFPLKMNVDERGSFTELVHTHAAGQVSINISKPGITKGQHWHNTKFEQFIVVKGHGLIQQRSLNDPEGKVLEWEVDGDHIQAVHMLPGYTHNIINLSDTEDLVTVMYCNEVFNPERPDTFFEPVK